MRLTGSAGRKLNVRDIRNSFMTMRKSIKPFTRFVVCIDNADYPAALELNKIYRAIPDEEAALDGSIRVIDESGEDYLYPSSYFAPIQVPQIVEESILRAS